MEKRCINCQKLLSSKKSNAKYCSNTCRSAYWRNKSKNEAPEKDMGGQILTDDTPFPEPDAKPQGISGLRGVIKSSELSNDNDPKDNKPDDTSQDDELSKEAPNKRSTEKLMHLSVSELTKRKLDLEESIFNYQIGVNEMTTIVGLLEQFEGDDYFLRHLLSLIQEYYDNLGEDFHKAQSVIPNVHLYNPVLENVSAIQLETNRVIMLTYFNKQAILLKEEVDDFILKVQDIAFCLKKQGMMVTIDKINYEHHELTDNFKGFFDVNEKIVPEKQYPIDDSLKDSDTSTPDQGNKELPIKAKEDDKDKKEQEQEQHQKENKEKTEEKEEKNEEEEEHTPEVPVDIPDCVMHVNKLKEMDYDALNFKGEWAELLGVPSVNFKLAVYGNPGQGKSNFCLQLAHYLSKDFGRVLFVCSEEGYSKTLKDKIILNGLGGTELYFSEIHSYEELKEKIKPDIFHFIILDSINNMGIDIKRLNALNEHYKNSATVSIAQATKKGELRGSQEIEHLVDITIKVDTRKATATKNRFCALGYVFDIEKNFIDPKRNKNKGKSEDSEEDDV